MAPLRKATCPTSPRVVVLTRGVGRWGELFGVHGFREDVPTPIRVPIQSLKEASAVENGPKRDVPRLTDGASTVGRATLDHLAQATVAIGEFPGLDEHRAHTPQGEVSTPSAAKLTTSSVDGALGGGYLRGISLVRYLELDPREGGSLDRERYLQKNSAVQP